MEEGSFGYKRYFVPSKRENRQRWMSSILDTVTQYVNSSVTIQRRLLYARKQAEIRGLWDKDLYRHIWQVWGIGGTKPMTFRNYALLETHIDSLVGMVLQQPLSFDLWKVNENAASERMDKKTKTVMMMIAEPYLKMLEQQMGMDIPVENRWEALPDSVKKYMTYDVRDMMEEAIFYDLTDLVQRYNVLSELANVFNDICENKFGYGKICYDGRNPYIRHIPIQNAICDEPLYRTVYSDTKKLNILGEDCFMNFEELCDSFGWIMDDEDIERIGGEMRSFVTNPSDYAFYNPPGTMNYYMESQSNECYARVAQIQVRAYKDHQFVSTVTAKGEEPERLEKRVKEVHCGLRVGRCITKTWKKRNQIPSLDNFSDLQTDYFGVFAKSDLHDKGWALQVLYNVLNMNKEFLINQAGGVAVEYNFGAKPEGYETDDIIISGKVDGIIPYQPQPGSVGQSVVGKTVDFGLKEGFNYIVNACHDIENSMSLITGVNNAILGAQGQYASGRLNEQMISQGTIVTSQLFHALTMFTEQGLQRMSDLVKYLHADDTTRSTIVGDMGLAVYTVTKDVSNYDYGIYVKNTMQVRDKSQQIDRLMAMTLSTNPDELIGAAVKMVNAVSPKEKQKILENALQFIQIAKQNQAQIENEMAAAQQDVQHKRLENESKKAEAMLTTPIAVANINKQGKMDAQAMKHYSDVILSEQQDEAAAKQQFIDGMMGQQQQQQQ